MYAVIGVPRDPSSFPSSAPSVSSAAPAASPPAPRIATPFGLGGEGGTNDIDPELLELPDPPRRQRSFTIAVLGLGALAALAMVFALRHDVRYALAAVQPASLGDLHGAPSAVLDGHVDAFVSGEALLGGAGGLRYERPLRDDTFRTLPVAGRDDLWVEVRVPAGQENGRWEPPHAFQGHLERLDGAGPSHRGLASAIEEATAIRVPRGALLLVDGEDPTHARWSILLASLFVGFAAWNALGIARLVRRLK
jgi:hypothetical protein